MGPYDNETEEYVFEQAVIDKGTWLISTTDDLYIVSDEWDSVFGPDEEIVDSITEHLRKGELSEAMRKNELDLVPQSLRRFDPEIGYYTA